MFSYFDPAANAYKTLHTDPIMVDVKKGGARPAIQNQPVTVTVTKGPDYKVFLWLLLFLAFAAIVVLLKRKKIIPVGKTVAAQTAAPTPAQTHEKISRDHLEAARFALAAVNSQLFYKETGNAAWSLLAEKFNLAGSQLNKPFVLRLLQEANTPPETIRLLEKVLNDCELALYTPVHTENDMRQTLEKAEQLKTALSGEL